MSPFVSVINSVQVINTPGTCKFILLCSIWEQVTLLYLVLFAYPPVHVHR